VTGTDDVGIGSQEAAERCPACGAGMGVEDWACSECGAIAGTVDKFPAKPDTRRHGRHRTGSWMRRLVRRRSRGGSAGGDIRVTLTPLGMALVTAGLAVVMAAVYLIGRSAW
jgi:hypothetical protein